MMGRASLIGLLCALGCGGTTATPDAGHDAGQVSEVDAGCMPPDPVMIDHTMPPPATPPACPTTSAGMPVPLASEQMGSCCFRALDPAQATAPEMRLNYVEIVRPEGSNLSMATIGSVLNQSVTQERFNWLFRLTPGATAGEVMITTGFGRRSSPTDPLTEPSAYSFSMGAAGGDPDSWLPVTVTATLDGETVSSEALDGSITVPVLDMTTGEPTLELVLRNVQIVTAEMMDQRRCIGWKLSRTGAFYHPAGILSGFIEVGPARTGMINVGPIMTTLCAAVAGDLDPAYCDRDQSMWDTRPDSLCDGTGCHANTACMTDVCDPSTTCNAWNIVAMFAASGADISP